MQHRVYSKASTVFYHTKKYIKWCCHCVRHYRNDSKTNTWNKYIVRIQFMLCTQKVWERGLKKWILLQSQSQQHDSHSSDGDAGIENRVTDKGGGEEEEGQINGESSMDAYTLTYVKR